MKDKFNAGVGTTINNMIENKKVYGMEYPFPPKVEQAPIGKVVEALSEFLMAKNKNYGNSALKPIKVFSKVEPTNSICVRMDDKISRIVNSTELRKNDIVDLTGYLVLLCAQKGWDDFKELID